MGTSLFVLLTNAAHGQDEKLRSPWDNIKIVQTDAPYNCPAPPSFAVTVDVDSYYVDSHASVIDPKKLDAFQKVSEPSTHLSQYVTLAADDYLAKGSKPAATCAYTLLEASAKADAWAGQMPGFQGVYLQNWLLSAVGIAYLKVRQSGAGTAEQDADIQQWFNHLAMRVREYFDSEIERSGLDEENNHLYWAGLAVAAEAIADNDHDAGRWAFMAYKTGIDAIQPDGSLRTELRRGQMALHYHLYALGPLVIFAELAEANDIDAYAYNGGAIHRLVNFCLAGLQDPNILEKRTGVKQVVTLPYSGLDIGWAVPYVKRFPNAALSDLIAKAPWVRFTSWGGAPPE
ncbi:MAG TPA: alginate lyase family protein [Terracidiphilus sp.]|jgi:poly(beta-D-mannuronate) lyase